MGGELRFNLVGRRLMAIGRGEGEGGVCFEIPCKGGTGCE